MTETPPVPAPAPVTSRHVARGVGTTLLSRLGAVIEIVSQPLYVWLFGLASFGLYAVLWAAINLIENIFDLGMTSAMQRTVPQSADDRQAADALRAALLLGVGPCLVVAAIICAMAEPVSLWLNVAEQDRALVTPAIRLFIWALPLWAFVEIATSALRARHLFGPEIRLRIVWEQIIRLVLAVLFFALGWGLTGLFVAHICSLAITALLSLRLLARHYRLDLLMSGRIASPIAAETAQAGLSILPSNIVARLFGDAPAVLLNMAIPGADGARAAALFTIARKLSSVVQLVRIAFVYVLAPLASSAERADREQVRAIYAYAVRLILVIATPLALVLSAGAVPLLALFGGNAIVARGAVIILLGARAIEAVVGISLPVLQVVGGLRHQLTASIAGLAIAAIAAWPLMQVTHPLTGATIAVSLGLITAAVIPMAQLQRHEALTPWGPDLTRAAVRTLGICLIALPVTLAIAFLPDAIALPLVICAAVMTIWLCMRFALPLADRESLGKTARKLRLIPARNGN